MSKSFETNAKRSEFLFCYDVRMANPNGDPDENRPRIDPITHRNLVTEFRLKRTIRDYLEKRLGQSIFMKEIIEESGKVKTIEDLAENYIKGKKKDRTVDLEKLISDHIDIRLFGLLFAVGGLHFKQTGPVQFGIGQSLNSVDEIQIRLTRIIPSRAEKKGGAFGEKYILRYSFIAFHGFLNDIIAKEVNLTEDDVLKMMKATWYGTNDLSTTSKFGQVSRLLLRVNYAHPNSFIGDLDTYLNIEPRDKDMDLKKLEKISQVTLDITNLLNCLKGNKKEISSLEYYCDEALVCKCDTETGTFGELLKEWAQETKVETKDLLYSWKESR